MKRFSATALGFGLLATTMWTGCSGGNTGGGSATGSSSSSSGSSTSSSGGEGGSGGQGGGGQGGQGGGVDPSCFGSGRIDLLLALDNSRSMADKQALLAQTVPDLVKGLVNPPCIDPNGALPPEQPATPSDACPAPLVRAFAPAADLHIGVISSSIGGHGSDSCPNVDANSSFCAPDPNTTQNDQGHLLARPNACSAQNVLPTYQSKGFLAWDPAQKLSPPGEDQLDDGMGGGLIPSLAEMVTGVGQIGCGYESQLESIYRFLVDPAPYATISVINGKATQVGTDTVLLAQRAAFLRPDSLLAVLMLTDENDCSTKEYGQFYYVNQIRNGATAVRLPRARAICATDPNNECCKSCGQADGQCPHDPTCDSGAGGPALLTADEDSINLRCFDQKRRFGIDFLYPIDRYTQAFTSPTIPNSAGEMVPNPLFMDLNPNDTIKNIRDPQHILVTGLVGVPWQNIAKDPLDVAKGYKSAAEMAKPDANGNTPWDVVLGDPANYVKPIEPLMSESVAPRAGKTYVTQESLVQPGGSPDNSVNGAERTIANDDLQYACIFPLPFAQQRDCTNTSLPACDCVEPTNDNPLCSPDPANGGQPTFQTRAKAYPSLRPLALLKSLGAQAQVGSVCPAESIQSESPAFGYKPLVSSVVSWISGRSCQ